MAQTYGLTGRPAETVNVARVVMFPCARLPSDPDSV